MESDNASVKGEEIADFIISLVNDNDFQKLLNTTSKQLSYRLLVDYILVCSSTATSALTLNMTSESPDYSKKVYSSMMDRFSFHLENMSDSGVIFNISDIVVDENEKDICLKQGVKLNQTMNIYNLFYTIGDYRGEKYAKAVLEGFFESLKERDSMRLTAQLLQESRKSCGTDNYPYLELKLIYTKHILKILESILSKESWVLLANKNILHSFED